MNDAAARVRAVLARHVAADVLAMVDQAPPEATYLQALGLDSPALLELVVDLEDTFGVEVASHDLYRLQTLGDLVKELSKSPGR